MSESREIRTKRLKLRAMRRGIKEMDLILSAYADRNLAQMSEDDLDVFEAILLENDQDLYAWVTGQTSAPDALAPMLDDISRTFEGKVN